MRTTTSIMAWAVLLPALAQQSNTEEHLADLAAHARSTSTVPSHRWSGAGGRFGPGEMIDHMPLRAIVWEFGDGGLGSILPPQPWSPEEGGLSRDEDMAPWREYASGSPCVSPAGPVEQAEAVGEPRPYIASTGDRSMLVTTGMGGRRLAVHAGDGVRMSAELASRRFASGRWALIDGADQQSGPLFLTLIDKETGERWYAGVLEP